jgi:hypothetical protein
MIYFAGARKCGDGRRSVEHGGLTIGAPCGAEGCRPARRQGRGRSLADDSESAKSPSISLGTRWVRSLDLPTNTVQRSLPVGLDFLYLQGKAQSLSAIRRQHGDVNHDRP